MNATTRTVEVVRKGERNKFKPKLWSHQDELKASIGKIINIWHSSDDGASCSTGELVCADQFTLQVRHNKSTVTYFKHAIVSYEIEG